MLAHRGTESNSVNSWIEDLMGIIAQNITKHQEAAYDLTAQAVQLAKDKDYHFSVTGHSLGAFLAEISVFYCHEVTDNNLYYPDVSAVTFESPGSKNFIENNLQNKLKKNPELFKKFDIQTYMAGANKFNTLNEHISTVYNLHNSEIQNTTLLRAHTIDNIISILENKITSIHYMIDWPNRKSFGFNKEADNNKKFNVFYKKHFRPLVTDDGNYFMLMKHTSNALQEKLKRFIKTRDEVLDSYSDGKKRLIDCWETHDVPKELRMLFLNYHIKDAMSPLAYAGKVLATNNINPVEFKEKVSKWIDEKSDVFNNICKKCNLKNIDDGETKIYGQIPPISKDFIERDEYIDQIIKKLGKNKIGTVTQSISGLGGIGKTQLVTKFVNDSLEKGRYKAIFWIPAETKSKITSVYVELARKLSVDISNLSEDKIKESVHNEIIEKYKEGHILFVLDNVKNAESIKNYINLLQTTYSTKTSLHILITSRSQKWDNNAIVLDGFSPDQAKKFIQQKLKKKSINESDENINKLAEALHYFPLALEQAVSYIEMCCTIDEYLISYDNIPQRYLNAKLQGDHIYKDTIWKILKISSKKLSPMAIQILSMSAYLEADLIPTELFNHLPKGDKHAARQELIEYSFITLLDNNKAFKIHRLLQDIIKLEHDDLQKHEIISNVLENIFNVMEFNKDKANLILHPYYTRGESFFAKTSKIIPSIETLLDNCSNMHGNNKRIAYLNIFMAQFYNLYGKVEEFNKYSVM